MGTKIRTKYSFSFLTKKVANKHHKIFFNKNNKIKTKKMDSHFLYKRD